MYIDENLPITCSECNEVIEGYRNMAAHIILLHPQYELLEAIEHAQLWREDAYAEEEQREMKATLLHKKRMTP